MTARKRTHFTLIELLAVIVIIAILVALTVGLVSLGMQKASISKTIAKMTAMEMALEEFQQDRGHYPSSASGVRIDGASSPFDTAAGFQSLQTGRTYLDGYMGGNKYTDGYGEAFYYKCPGTRNPEKFDLWSAGNDGISLNADDISNWKQN
ncbi:MAG: type II secretion system protein GspG [Lentisphaeria bacterium]|nr:type II secretion system protein GspG [Lentisphaeria bacterium]